MPPTDPRVLAELDGEQRTDGQTPPAAPDPEVVERIAKTICERRGGRTWDEMKGNYIFDSPRYPG
jgi:hypothetical protein